MQYIETKINGKPHLINSDRIMYASGYDSGDDIYIELVFAKGIDGLPDKTLKFSGSEALEVFSALRSGLITKG